MYACVCVSGIVVRVCVCMHVCVCVYACVCEWCGCEVCVCVCEWGGWLFFHLHFVL